MLHKTDLCSSAVNIDHKSVKCMDRVQGMLIKTALGLPKNRRISLLLASPWYSKDRAAHQETATLITKKQPN